MGPWVMGPYVWDSAKLTADSIAHGEIVGVCPLSAVGWLNSGIKRPVL